MATKRSEILEQMEDAHQRAATTGRLLMWYVWYRKRSNTWQHKRFKLYENARLYQVMLGKFGFETTLRQGAVD